MTQPAPRQSQPAPAGQARRIDALLVDLDGVVTRTATVHAHAWKRLFDAFLERRGASPPFDEVADYRAHVDGKPRYDGVRDFLAARGITLPEGDPGDPPGWDTVCALGNMKDGYFHEALEADGVELFAATVARLREAKAEGVRLAAVSASRNAAAVLAKAGLAELFDCRVDGVELARLGLPGKPAPDMFLHAAAQLGVAPARAGVIEDAIAGVEAGHAGGFALVIGIGDGARAESLRAAGADIVVPDLGGLDLDAAAPSALAHFDAVAARIGGRPALFLDYDGTLTPIVDRPELAVLAEATRAALARLAALCPVAVVSGRARADVERLVGLDSLVYAGSHGFDIKAPGGAAVGQAVDRHYLDALAAAADGLRAKLRAIDGVIVEDKTYAVAVHYRLVAEGEVDAVERAVAEAAAAHPELRRTGGKKIFELRPALDWDKGKAVLALIDALGLEGGVVPIYVGDDETDYDAFEALAGRGIGVLVSDGPPPRPVDYCLRDAGEVRDFLGRLADLLGGEAR